MTASDVVYDVWTVVLIIVQSAIDNLLNQRIKLLLTFFTSFMRKLVRIHVLLRG